MILFYLLQKVHIASISLKPTFEYDTVPKLAQHAFLRAKVTNNSTYPLLGGPANVFLDKSYVTETTLNSTSPKEEFSCSLGKFTSPLPPPQGIFFLIWVDFLNFDPTLCP